MEVWCWCEYRDFCRYYNLNYRDWRIYRSFCYEARLDPNVYSEYWHKKRWVGRTNNRHKSLSYVI
jgi:hypothetical protein